MAAQVIPFEQRKRQREGIIRQLENAYEAFRKCGANVKEPACAKEPRVQRHLPNAGGLFLVSQGSVEYGS
jgi:hypothetical protein